MSAVRRTDGRLTVALVSEVFWQPDGRAVSTSASTKPLGGERTSPSCRSCPPPWRPATKDAVDDDAEPMGGPRMAAQAEAARRARIGLVGGIIHRDVTGGGRAAPSSTQTGSWSRPSRSSISPRSPASGRRATRARDGGGPPDRRVRDADRDPGLLRQQSAGGVAPPRSAGRGGDPRPARLGGRRTSAGRSCSGPMP